MEMQFGIKNVFFGRLLYSLRSFQSDGAFFPDPRRSDSALFNIGHLKKWLF